MALTTLRMVGLSSTTRTRAEARSEARSGAALPERPAPPEALLAGSLRRPPIGRVRAQAVPGVDVIGGQGLDTRAGVRLGLVLVVGRRVAGLVGHVDEAAGRQPAAELRAGARILAGDHVDGPRSIE